MIITITSDFGLRDPAVATTKAIVLQHAPDAAIVDVCHMVEANDLQHAAYLLQSVCRRFPTGTVHLMAAAMFQGTILNMMMIERQGSFVIAPDNGILPLAFPGEKLNTKLCFTLSGPFHVKQWAEHVGKVVDDLKTRIADLPYVAQELRETPRVLQPRRTADGIECNVLFIDRYENVVLGITRQQFETIAGSKPFRIKMSRMDDIETLSYNYNDVPEGKPLCRFNEAGYLEIALNRDKAASWLGLNNFSSGIRYQTIKIFLSV